VLDDGWRWLKVTKLTSTKLQKQKKGSKRGEKEQKKGMNRSEFISRREGVKSFCPFISLSLGIFL